MIEKVKRVTKYSMRARNISAQEISFTEEDAVFEEANQIQHNLVWGLTEVPQEKAGMVTCQA